MSFAVQKYKQWGNSLYQSRLEQLDNLFRHV